MLSQAKIDLAVLYKLHQHAEGSGEAVTPEDIAMLFSVKIPQRRIEVALQGLEEKGEVVREYHPHYNDVGLWQVSRTGMEVVDRAVRVPASFIGRLHANGDKWLESDEAEAAVLKKIAQKSTQLVPQPEEVPPPNEAADRAIHIHNNVTSTNTNTVSSPQGSSSSVESGARATWFSGWATWVGAAIALAALALGLLQAKVF